MSLVQEQSNVPSINAPAYVSKDREKRPENAPSQISSAISTLSSDSSLIAPTVHFRVPENYLPISSAPRPQSHSTKPSHGIDDDSVKPTSSVGVIDTPNRTATVQSSGQAQTQKMDSPSDFQFGDDIGEGSWSSVVEAVHCGTKKTYAIKILNKAQLIREKKTRFAGIEKEALRLLNDGKHPGIIRLYSTFQDTSALYFVLALAPNGDIREFVKRIGSLSLPCARYYSAQILDTVQWIHSRGILHRDLKPENVLLDEKMRIKLTDFGSAFISKDHDLSPRTSTFVGSAAYVSPELLSSKTTSQSSDIWAIGCIIYFLLFGKSPFMALTEYLTFKKIEALDYSFPDSTDADAQDIVRKTLVLDPSERLGATPKSSPNDIRSHPFFIGPASEEGTTGPYINWDTLWTQLPVPIEVGLFKAPPPGEIENRLANGMQWNDFVNQFSLIDQMGEEETRIQSGKSGDVRDGIIQPYDITSPLQQLSLSPLAQQYSTEHSTDNRNVNVPKPHDTVTIAQNPLVENHMDGSKLPWSFVLLPSESIRLITSVEVKTGRLIFSKAERRTLVLTSLPRLICVKVKQHSEGKSSITVKQKFVFPDSDKTKSSASDLVISGIALQKEVILGIEIDEKTYTYTFLNHAEAKRWAETIQGHLNSLLKL